VDSDKLGKLIPAISYKTVEETSVLHNQDISTECSLIGSLVAVYQGRVVFQVSNMGGMFAQELYVEQAPWSMWNDPVTIGAVRQVLSPNLSQAMLSRLPMKKLLTMYAAAVCIPQTHQGPLQQRLVA
jgi:hypothetical protein